MRFGILSFILLLALSGNSESESKFSQEQRKFLCLNAIEQYGHHQYRKGLMVGHDDIAGGYVMVYRAIFSRGIYKKMTKDESRIREDILGHCELEAPIRKIDE